MKITQSEEAVNIVKYISGSVHTFHHHIHILYDIAKLFNGIINYVEIGCYSGASSCMMLQRENTNVFSIDVGAPISPEEAKQNVARFNIHNNKFLYIQGNSHVSVVVNKLKDNLSGGIDILFIDGGHSYSDVIEDFNLYNGLVKDGGFIVFDDYLDKEFSPEVCLAVDKIVSGLGQDYEKIGSIPNTIGAHPAEVKNLNSFILRKIKTTIGVVISTYKRPDGRTPFYLERALNCIQKQTFKNYHIYVIGDNYTDDVELKAIVSQFSNITSINLSHSLEREKYALGDFRLWCIGGNNAALTGISLAISDGVNYICHLDHDDWWDPFHLELINNVIVEKNPFFICTLSTYGGSHLPGFKPDHRVFEFSPVPGGMITSSSCIKYSETKLRARDCAAALEENPEDFNLLRLKQAMGLSGVNGYPADADLWYRLAEEMSITGKKGYVCTTISCHHDEEGYTRRII